MPEYMPARREANAWAVGFTGFAAFMMILVGLFHAMVGLVAIFQKTFFVTTKAYVFQFNITTWGWIHLAVGVIVVLAGLALFSGSVWARTLAVILAVISAVANFAFLPYYPLWSALIIGVDIAVIWAVTTHGRDITMRE